MDRVGRAGTAEGGVSTWDLTIWRDTGFVFADDGHDADVTASRGGLTVCLDGYAETLSAEIPWDVLWWMAAICACCACEGLRALHGAS